MKLRNVQAIRNHIIELIVIIVNSSKGKSLTLPIIKTVSVADKMTARDETAIQPFIKYGDTKELQLASNEFITSIKRNDSSRALFWLSWISTIEKLSIKDTPMITFLTKNIGKHKSMCPPSSRILGLTSIEQTVAMSIFYFLQDRYKM